MLPQAALRPCPRSVRHGQLQRSGHFNNILAIAQTLSSSDLPIGGYGAYALYITHIFAVLDSLGEEHPVLEAVQMYPSWPLILKAWRHIFSFIFFNDATNDNWKYIDSTGYLETLPSLVAYAMKYWERWNPKEETHRLIQLVGRVCDRLDEEHRGQGEHDVAPLGLKDDALFGHGGIPHLGKQIRELLSTLLEDL